MTSNATLIITSAAAIGCAVYLLLERSLTRVLIGLVLLSNGVNILFLVASGRAGSAPIIGGERGRPISDPLPQALVLTAIVISLGTTAFLLAMAYRSWQLTGHDDVQDDVEDARVRQLAAADETSDSFDLTDDTSPADAAEEEGGRHT